MRLQCHGLSPSKDAAFMWPSEDRMCEYLLPKWDKTSSKDSTFHHHKTPIASVSTAGQIIRKKHKTKLTWFCSRQPWAASMTYVVTSVFSPINDEFHWGDNKQELHTASPDPASSGHMLWRCSDADDHWPPHVNTACCLFFNLVYDHVSPVIFTPLLIFPHIIYSFDILFFFCFSLVFLIQMIKQCISCHNM